MKTDQNGNSREVLKIRSRPMSQTKQYASAHHRSPLESQTKSHPFSNTGQFHRVAPKKNEDYQVQTQQSNRFQRPKKSAPAAAFKPQTTEQETGLRVGENTITTNRSHVLDKDKGDTKR